MPRWLRCASVGGKRIQRHAQAECDGQCSDPAGIAARRIQIARGILQFGRNFGCGIDGAKDGA